MNARILAEIGSWVAIHAGGFVNGIEPQPALAAKEYWVGSKCRLQRWASALKMFEHDLSSGEGHNPWHAIEVVVQEILVSELLTRVWSTAMITHDTMTGGDELYGLAHGIHIGHVEAKNRALRIMLKGQASNEKEFDRLNKLRRRIERWTDLFLAQMPVCEQASCFGFDAARVHDFRRENTSYTVGQLRARQAILCASMDQDLSECLIRYPANPVLNRQIASGVIACFPTDRFDSLGLPKSARLLWIENAQNDTQVLMDQLLGFEDLSDQQSVRTIERD